MTLNTPAVVDRLNPPTMMPPLGNLYSQITIAPAGRQAFIAGQVALDRDGKLVGEGDHRQQAVQCFANLLAALEALNAQPDQVLRMGIFVAGHCPDTVEAIFSAGHEVFGSRWPVCASVMLGVQTLAMPAWLVEVDAVVAMPGP